MPIEVTLASTDDERSEAFAFRYDLYCRDQQILLDVADHDRGELHDEDDATATLMVARDGGRVVGTLRANWGGEAPFSPDLTRALALDRLTSACDPGSIGVLSRFLIAADHRGGDVSSLLILKAAELCRERGIAVVVCDCEPHLLGYYRQLGFRPYGQLFCHATSLLVPLVLFIGDRTHLQAVGSPVALLFPEDHCPPPDQAMLDVLSDASASQFRPADGRASIAQLIERTGSAPGLLQGLSDEQLELLTEESFVLDFSAGDLIIGQGTTTRTLYGILDGVVEITAGGRTLAVATAGDVIGEMAMLLDRTRSATARAASDGRALSISDRAMTRLLERQPHLAANVLWNLSRVLAHKLGNLDQATT